MKNYPFSSFFQNRKELQRLLSIHAVVFILAVALYGAYYLKTAHGFEDADGNPVGRDFIAFWTASDFLKKNEPLAVYSPERFTTGIQHFFPSYHPELGGNLTWRYPPPAFFLLWPLSFFSQYGWAAVFWIFMSLLAFGTALFYNNGVPGLWRFIAFSAPAVLINIDMGQTGLLWAALFIGGFRCMQSAPVFAGVLFGCLIFKPHFALLIPVVLWVLKQYRVFFFALLTAGALIGASALAFGWESWKIFFTTILDVGGFQSQYYSFGATTSLYAMVQFLPLWLPVSHLVCTIAYISLVVFLVILLCIALRNLRQAHWSEQLMLISPAVYLVSPCGLSYDLCMLSGVWILWLAHKKDDTLHAGESVLCWLVWYVPFLWQLPFLQYAYRYGLHIMPLLLVGLFIVEMRKYSSHNPISAEEPGFH